MALRAILAGRVIDAVDFPGLPYFVRQLRTRYRSDMKAYFTRDSVCAGDDGDAPHAREIDLPEAAGVDEQIKQVIAAARLPTISGGKATWSLSSIHPLAVVAEQWPQAKLIHQISPKLADLDVDKNGTLRLHFSYFAQRDPDAVFDVLRNLTTRSR